jgi:hypothetical protein
MDGRSQHRKPSASAKKSLAPRDKAADKKAAQGYERERQRREREEAREEAARQKEHARRQKTVDKAQAALDNAEEEHAKRLAELCSQMEALGKKVQAEETNSARKQSG